jgi:hypothetical protein
MPGDTRAFRDFLGEHRQGKTHDLLSDKWQEVVAAVAEIGKTGEMIVKFKMKPMNDKNSADRDDPFVVTVEVTQKMPKEPAPESIYYVTPSNNLTKRSPQQDMELSPGGPALIHKGAA